MEEKDIMYKIDGYIKWYVYDTAQGIWFTTWLTKHNDVNGE